MTSEEAQVSSEPTLPEHFVKWWVFRTVVGCLISALVVFIPFIALSSVGNVLKFSHDFIQLLFAIWFAAAIPVFGAIVGYIQWSDSLLVFLPRKLWMIASAVGSATGALGLYYSLFYAPSLFSKYVRYMDIPDDVKSLVGKSVLSDKWFITILIWSVSLGGGLSIAQWTILRTRYSQSYWMLAGNIGGLLGAFLLALLISALSDYSNMVIYLWCSLPIIGITGGGLALRYILKQK